MQGSRSLKQEFMKKWVMGLQICSSSSSKKEYMSILERKEAIKLSADLAMASARNGTTRWSRAVIANATSKDGNNKVLVDHILGRTESAERLKKASIMGNKRVVRSKKMLKRSSASSSRRVVLKKRSAPHHINVQAAAGSIAKRLVKKRTHVLKTLIPGGQSMDGLSLMEETLDYIISLRAQVDVMRHLANAA